MTLILCTLQNKEEDSPYNNILRTTTECMSAIFGGANAIMVNSYNQSFEIPTIFSERIARNQQTILKKESYFDKVIDPTKGSYYVDYLVNELLADFNIKPSEKTKIDKWFPSFGFRKMKSPSEVSQRIFLILLHSGKSGGVSDMFGGSYGGGSAGGSTVVGRNLDRLTVLAATLFALTTLWLTWLWR